MFTLDDILIATVLLLLLLLWWNAQGAKHRALAATRAYCKQMEVQLLDEAVALRGFWLKRDSRGHLRLWRSYSFEFTATGDDRYSGKVVLLGARVEQIQLEPHRLN